MTPALLVAAPMAAAAAIVALNGVETRGRRLEEIAQPAAEGAGPSGG